MGPFGSNIKAENFTNTGIPVIRGTNLNYYRYVDGEFVYLTEEKANQLKSSNCFPGDIVITHRGTLGQVGLIPFGKHDRYVVSQSGMKVTVNPNFLDSNFLLYFFKSNIGQNELLQHESQVRVPSISNPLTSLKSVSLNLPPIEEQKAIASVLSSLDDKIDLLHRQNKTLEAMAETLFRQWFVEETQEDWGVVELGDAVETTSGGMPSRSKMEYYENGSIHWVKSKELSGSFILETEEMITENALRASSAKLLPANSILIAMYGATVGEYAIISKEMTCNQAICAIKPNENYPYTFLFMFIKNNKDHLINMAVGSA
jgi:type I restriction enzyme S subunit